MYEVSAEGRLGMASINIEDFHRRIEKRFSRGNVTLPILVLGPVGVGKTEGVVELAKKLGVGFMSLRLANYQETDLIGLPKIVERTNISSGYTEEEISRGKNLAVQWVQQGFLPDPHSATFNERGILFLDEITNASRGVQAAAWQLMDSTRGIGDYTLPDGWLIVAAGNGPEDGGAYNGLTSALLGRCECFRVEPNFESWRNWAIGHGVHFSVIAYLTMNNDSLWKWDPLASVSKAAKFPQPRVWAEVSKNLTYAEEEVNGATLSHSDVMMECMGWIGEEEAHLFSAFYVLKDQMVDMEAIANGAAYKSVRDMRIEVKYMQSECLVQTVMKYVRAYNKGRNEEDFKKVMNCIKFWMELAEESIDIGVTIFEEIGRSTAVAEWLMFNVTNMARIGQACPSWNSFYNTHSKMFSK